MQHLELAYLVFEYTDNGVLIGWGPKAEKF